MALRPGIVLHARESGVAFRNRVKVYRDPEYPSGPWPAEPTGVARSAELVATHADNEWVYWVSFDAPQVTRWRSSSNPYAPTITPARRSLSGRRDCRDGAD